jgi:hypothetical protein
MIERLTYIVGKDCKWRRDNLLKCSNCIDKGSSWEVTFQYIEHDHNNRAKQVTLTYILYK